MKKTLLITLTIAAGIQCKAQTVTPVVLSNGGGYSSLSAGSISWSIGEPVSESYTNSSKITTMGFHQPEVAIVTLLKEQGETKSLLVYPNPVKDYLNVNFSGLVPGHYTLELMDALGKIIYVSEKDISATDELFILKVNDVAAADYFLKVQSKEFLKTIKINKIN